MAVSDPATDVPTPTGTLQGVAAFSWDGAAWQPAGRAGPAVATPTGVLRGVAAFNGGPSWQPTGRAQPGVATPTGVLDGVAVYTWSGSAWTPVGGQATPSTPSGALQGVAAFSWDGAAWQPAGQAGPSVATPYGVLAGVAMFGWTGSAWAAAGAPSLSLDFMTPGTLDPRITFTRASTATYFDSSGVMQTATTNTPRWDYDPVTHALRGLLIEEARTNVQPNSVLGTGWQAAGATQALGGSVVLPTGVTSTTALVSASDTTTGARNYSNSPLPAAVAATTAYALTVFLKASPNNAYIQVNTTGGTTGASIAYFDLTNGTAVVGTDLATALTSKSVSIAPVGNGWFRCGFMFTTLASNVTATIFIGPCVTVSASGDNRAYPGVVGQGLYCWGAQLEAGTFPTSYFPTTGAAATRAVDVAAMPTSPWYNNAASTLAVEAIWPSPVSPSIQTGATIDDGSNSGNLVRVYRTANANTVVPQVIASSTTIYNPTIGSLTAGAVTKAAVAYSAGLQASALNGVNGTGATQAAVPSSITTLRIGLISGNIQVLNGYACRVRYWPRALSNAELQAVTT